MNNISLRLDKVIRLMGLGSRKVYSLIVSDGGLYIIRTGAVSALKNYRVDETTQRIVTDAQTDRSVAEIQSNEAKIGATPLDQLVGGDNYFVRLAAIEDVIVRDRSDRLGI